MIELYDIDNIEELGLLLWVSKWFKPDKKGRYFTGETREQIISKLNLQNESEKIKEANIQYYLALRNYQTLRTEKAKKILDKAQKQFYKAFESEEKAKARQQLVQDVVKSIKQVSIKVAEAGERTIGLIPYLPYIAIGLAVLYIYSLGNKRRDYGLEGNKNLWQIFDNYQDAKNEARRWEIAGYRTKIKEIYYKGYKQWGVFVYPKEKQLYYKKF
ncbi:MAG: hypothetical protein QW156_05035 [Candidatus Aenigmatarchaeota archaeon]